MENRAYDNEYFRETLLHPDGVSRDHSTVISAVNAAAIVTGMPWRSVVKTLVEQSHIRKNLPTYKVCVTDMMRAVGFKRLGTTYGTRVGSLLDMLNSRDDKSLSLIVKLSYYGYFAVAPAEGCGYVLKGLHLYGRDRDMVGSVGVDETWVYCPGTDNRTGIVREQRKKRRHYDNKSLVVNNMNPQQKYVGDCAVRALSATYGCTWDEAVDLLAETSDYNDPVINSTHNINATLARMGYKRCDGSVFDCYSFSDAKRLCAKLNSVYTEGERIFAYSGSSHCIAILPVAYPDGKSYYKVQDTWDSTMKYVEEYWVYKDPENIPERPVPCPQEIKHVAEVGERISHPQFGDGEVVSISGSERSRILEVEFPEEGRKSISERWLVENT